ncbi:uncharacterized protein [Musca autumnalis]|uniref:uncharacterized protein n=1 Tax=Musca autumnalis TaxID=221902 RepID=UPI003CF2012C
MNDNDCEMYDISAQTSSRNGDDPTEIAEEDENTSLWSIDDDTMFYAKGLKNHSAGKGKSVFVTWNEKYLMNFVFKTSSKKNKTTLTKVRLNMPMFPDTSDEREEILDMLILEMNTLLLMESGRVYYFSSVKSIHCVPWLQNVRCLCTCPCTQFSVIRLMNDQGEEKPSKKLLLEVYQDIPQLGKCPSSKDALRHSYDITFDIENIFNCDWICDRYILVSLIADEENIQFLKRLVEIGNVIRSAEERVTVELNQEIHLFTVSGNLFFLLGGFYVDNEDVQKEKEPDYSIHLLNTYANPIECIKIDCKKNLLIVLLESGHMDIWYKSTNIVGSINRLKHEISNFTYYDYSALDNTFYITKPDEVTQLRLTFSKEIDEQSDEEGPKHEFVIKEVHKAISGMVACTWVESLQQLVCLSINNIFYRLCFELNDKEYCKKDVADGYESFQTLYSLTNKKMKLLLSRSQIVNQLMELPKQLNDAVELEWQKQQLLAMGFKKIWKNLFKCNIEYHQHQSTIKYLNEIDAIFLRTTFDGDTESNEIHTMYSVMCLTTTTTSRRDNLFLTIMQTTTWHLQIGCEGEMLLIQIPPALLNKKLYILIKFFMKNRMILPDFSLHILCFVKHCSSYICIRNEIPCFKTENTFRNLFSFSKQINIYRNVKLNIDYLLEKFYQEKPLISSTRTVLRQNFKNLNKQEFFKILDISEDKYRNDNSFKLYYLQEHHIAINYNASEQQLEISTQKPESMFYLKMLLMWKLKSVESVDLTNSKENHLQRIMQCQSEIESLYGSLTSIMETDDIGGAGQCSSSVSLHLENLMKIYTKLRCEFDNIFS